MEDYTNLYHQCILNVRIALLKAEYYRNHRAEFEEDLSGLHLFLAEENLNQAESLVRFVRG